MIRIITIDHSNPAEVADFHAAWKLPAHRVAAIQARAANDRRFADEVRTLGKVAAISAQVQRTIKGATHP